MLRTTANSNRASWHARIVAAVALAASGAMAAAAQPASSIEAAGRRIAAAYPDHLAAVEDGVLVWRDGSRMPIDDGQGQKRFEDWLATPDLEDMLAQPYPAGAAATAPALNADPGRARNAAFFNRMYGDCRKGEVARHLTDVVWLPRKSGQRLQITRINGVDRKLAAVSAELDLLPARFDGYLVPSAGTYNCRPIAGTDRVSAHGHGIAIDIATRHASYWRWTGSRAGGHVAYANSVPMEIVRIFEKHGFIWGGRWYHFDTMRFEYRPELLPAAP